MKRALISCVMMYSNQDHYIFFLNSIKISVGVTQGSNICPLLFFIINIILSQSRELAYSVQSIANAVIRYILATATHNAPSGIIRFITFLSNYCFGISLRGNCLWENVKGEWFSSDNSSSFIFREIFRRNIYV